MMDVAGSISTNHLTEDSETKIEVVEPGGGTSEKLSVTSPKYTILNLTGSVNRCPKGVINATVR